MDGEFRNNDPSESISGWCEVPPSELLAYADRLATMQQSWSNWGLFRAASIQTLAEYCAKAEL
jgi:hypothetical protein